MRLLLLACLFCLLTPVRWVLAADPVSLSVKEAPVKDVLQSLAQLANQNLVVDPDLSGTVSLELRDVPFRQALTVVTRSRGWNAGKKAIPSGWVRRKSWRPGSAGSPSCLLYTSPSPRDRG